MAPQPRNRKSNPRRKPAAKPKRAQTPRPPTRSAIARAPRRVPQNLVRQVCAQYDAFCPAARGAKIPDNSCMSTVAFQSHGRHTLAATDASGRAGALVILQNKYESITDFTTFSGTTGTIGVAGFNNATLASVKDYRIVSAGLRIRCIYPPLTTQGMLHIRIPGLGVDGLDSGTTSINVTSYNVSQSYDIALRDVHDLVIAIPRNGALPVTYYPTDLDYVNPASSSSHGYLPIVIGVTGGPATATVLDIEYIVNYEYVFESGDSQNAIATASPPSNPLINDAVSHVTAAATNVFTAGAAALGRYAERTAANYLSAALADTQLPALAMLTL